MKKLLPILLALIVLLTACGGNASDSFNKYLDNSDTYSNRLLPSGAAMNSCDLKRDSDKYYTTLNFTPCFDDTNTYAWAALTPSEKKEDMRYISEMVISYANSKDWDNDYYLYIAVEESYASFVYDYEADTLFYSSNFGVYRAMYKQFNTMDAQELLGSKEGEDFLLKYKLAEIKHMKVELIAPTDQPTNIFDGKLGEFGLVEPKAY